MKRLSRKKFLKTLVQQISGIERVDTIPEAEEVAASVRTSELTVSLTGSKSSIGTSLIIDGEVKVNVTLIEWKERLELYSDFIKEINAILESRKMELVAESERKYRKCTMDEFDFDREGYRIEGRHIEKGDRYEFI